MMLDFGDGFLLRAATVADHGALCMICLKTGDAGNDASAREDDPELMGQIYAVPYQVFEPDFAFVIMGPHGPAGYLFGAPDSSALNARLASEWYPRLQRAVSDPGADPSRWRGSDWARDAICRPALTLPPVLRRFPSHGHIDLLPEARGRGIGRRCMTFLEQTLAATGSTGMHLDVNPRNDDAQLFYRRLGFRELPDQPLSKTSLYMVKAFSRSIG